MSRGVIHASEGEWKAVPDLLERLPLPPSSLAGDTGYSVGQLRELLEDQDITAYIRPCPSDPVLGKPVKDRYTAACPELRKRRVMWMAELSLYLGTAFLAVGIVGRNVTHINPVAPYLVAGGLVLIFAGFCGLAGS